MNPLYKGLLSTELCHDLLSFYRNVEGQLPMQGGRNFPVRRQCRDLPDELTAEATRQIHVALAGYYTVCHIRPTARIYGADYGRVLPHRDVATYPGDNATILVYLTDSFSRGACGRTRATG